MVGAHEHPAYKEGVRSYKKNNGHYANPYPLGSEERNLFERGWTQALKRAPNVPFNGTNKLSSNRSRYEENKELKRKREAKEAYLRSKGR